MEQRLSIITLGVQDLEKATEFYIQKFGWTKDKRSTEGITFIHLNGLFLGLYPKAKLAEDAGVKSASVGFRGISLAYNTRTEAEVDTLFQRFEESGVQIIKAPEKAFWGGYSGYIADLDGYLWEIAFNPFLTIDENGNVT